MSDDDEDEDEDEEEEAAAAEEEVGVMFARLRRSGGLLLLTETCEAHCAPILARKASQNAFFFFISASLLFTLASNFSLIVLTSVGLNKREKIKIIMDERN